MNNMWGVLWRSNNRLEGETSHLCYEHGLPKLFTTRSNARRWIEERYGYIRGREGLRGEPFGWRVPIAVKVTVSRLEERS